MEAISKYNSNGPGLVDSMKFGNDVCKFIGTHYHLGDFYKLKVPLSNIYVVTDTDVLHEIMILKEPNFLKSRIYWGELKKIVGKALGTTEGDEWGWLKRIQSKHFTHTAVEEMMNSLAEVNTTFFNTWEQKDEPLDLIKAFSGMNIAFILKQLFGLDENGFSKEISEYIADGEEIISWRSKYPWRPHTIRFTKKLERQKRYLLFFENLTKKIIEEAHLNPKNNLWNSLWNNSVPGGSKPLSFEELRNEVIIHLGASTETAAVAEGWTIYLLHKHPHVLEKVRNEILSVTAGKPVENKHYESLVYTTLVLKESLRLYPPSHSLIRDAQNDETINGIPVKAGDTFFVSVYGIHHNPKIWVEPESFIPERFEHEDSFIKHAYIPFGVGRHNCIGRFLAMPMMVISIAEFVRRFDFKINSNKPIVPVSLSTLKPSEPLMTTLQKRL